MDYQDLWKEEKQIQIMKIASNAEEIIDALREVEDKQKQSILPLYDFIIEMILAGDDIDKEFILKYYGLFTNTYSYSSQQLAYAVRSFAYAFNDNTNSMLSLLPWYHRWWYRFAKWFSRLMQRFE